MSRYLDRPARGPAEHPHAATGPRSSPPTATSSLEAIEVRDGATGETSRGSSPAACSSSSGPTPRPRGCRPRSRSTAAATCSPAPTCAPPAAGSSSATRTCSRRACPGIFACGDVRFGPVKRVAAAVGEGSMAIAFVHQYLRQLATRRAARHERREGAAATRGRARGGGGRRGRLWRRLDRERSHVTARDVTLVDRSTKYAHCDPIYDEPASNDFLKTVVPFLKRLPAER